MTDYQFITDFHRRDFCEMFKEYFTELGINVTDWEKLWDEMSDGKNKAYLCFVDGEAAGFLMFTEIDFESWFFKTKYGFIREFWVAKSYRGRGMGTELLRRAEDYFKGEGLSAAILTTETAEGFYLKNGYRQRGDIIAKNGDRVFVKELEKHGGDMVVITVSDYPSDELLSKIADAQWGRPDSTNSIRFLIDLGKKNSDCFNVIAQDGDKVVGRLFCLKNEVRPELWYYGDLFVSPYYRRRHIAENMLMTAEKTVTERGGEVLRVYVEPENEPSLEFQRKNGYLEKPYEEFDELINDGRLMFEKKL